MSNAGNPTDVLVAMCDVCGKKRSEHSISAGIPICPGIFAPTYRSTKGDRIAELETEAKAQASRIAELEGALKPFANLRAERVVARLNGFVQCGCCDEEWPQLRHDTVHLIDAQASRIAELREALAYAESILTAVSSAGVGEALNRVRKALSHSSERGK